MSFYCPWCRRQFRFVRNMRKHAVNCRGDDIPEDGDRLLRAKNNDEDTRLAFGVYLQRACELEDP